MKAPLLTLGIICILLPVQLLAQGTLHIVNNATLKVVGNATIKLNNASLENDGNFVAGSGTVEFQGSTATGVQINGTQITTFNHLTVNRPVLSVQLGKQTQVNGNLTFTNGTLDLNGNDLVIGQPGGFIVNETATNRITGSNGGEVVLTATLANPAQINPGNIGVTFSSMANLGATTIRRGHVPATLSGVGNSVARYFSIQPTNNTGLDATLRFHYFDTELNSLPEANLSLYRGLGATWKTGTAIGTGTQTRDNAQNWVQKAGVGQFVERWTLAECAPVSGTTSKSICPGTTLLFNNQNLSLPGIYKDTLTSANGCDSVVTLTLSLLIAPPADAGANQRVCAGGSLTLTASGGQSYLWDDGSSSASIQITPQTSGKKFVTVTGANGCTAKDSVQVDVNPVPDVIPETDKTYCNGQTTIEILHQSNFTGAFFDGTNNTPSIGLPASGTNVIKIASFITSNTGNNPVTATLTVTPKLTLNGLTCIGKSDSFSITVNPSPKPQISGSLSFCMGKTTTLTASGGNTFIWNTGGSGAILDVGTAGVYTVTSTNAQGCTATATAQVTAEPPPSPSFGPNNIFAVCKGDSITLNPGIFSKYLWNTGVATPTLLVPSSVALYTVTVTNANNCTATATASINELPLLGVSIAPPDTLDCSTTQIVLDGSGSASGPSITYAWTTTGGNIVSGGTTNKATVNKLGTYTLMVSGPAQSCPNTATVTVIEQKDAPTSAVLTPKNVTCKGKNDGQLTIGQVNGGVGPYTYSLNGATFQSTTTFNTLSAGTYTLTIQGSNGCTTTQSFSIQEGALLSPALGSDRTICPGASITLDAGSFFGYLWSDNQTSSTITVSTPGMYTVTVSDAQGCTGTDVLEIKNHPPVTAQATSSDILTCNKSQVTLNSTGSTSGAGIQYLWTTANGLIQSGANGPSPIVTEGGVYQLLVTNAASTCTATATVSVTETGEQVSAVNIEPVNIQCAGKEDGEITIASVGNGALPFSYSLNNGPFQADNVFTNLKPGQYSLIVRGADGCEATVNTSLTAPPPLKVTVPAPPALLKEGSSFTLNPSVTGAQGTIDYAWQGSKLSCEDCAMPDVSPIFQSVYRLTVTDANGCTATATVSVDVDSQKGPDIITPGNEDGKNDELEFPELEEEPAKALNDIIILNRWGQVVFEAQPYQNNWNGVTQDGKELPEGTYYYVLTLRGGNKSVIHGSVLIIR